MRHPHAHLLTRALLLRSLSLSLSRARARVQPGYNDDDYKRRRMSIAHLARDHVPGEALPAVTYRPEEVETWAHALTELEKLFPTHACREFLESYAKLGFRPDRVPQLQDVHDVLQRETGFAIRPVAGLLHPRDFLNGLAFRTFHSTQVRACVRALRERRLASIPQPSLTLLFVLSLQYMRHFSQPMYTPEPDVIHELIGHAPMLANPHYADLVQQIGLASLYATKEEIWHLSKVYWYTVEFGVVMEGDDVKAFGAGLLSSFGELEHMQSGEPKPALERLDPWAKQPKMSYKDGFQKRYFVLDSFEEGAELLRRYAKQFTDREADFQ